MDDKTLEQMIEATDKAISEEEEYDFDKSPIFQLSETARLCAIGLYNKTIDDNTDPDMPLVRIDGTTKPILRAGFFVQFLNNMELNKDGIEWPDEDPLQVMDMLVLNGQYEKLTKHPLWDLFCEMLDERIAQIENELSVSYAVYKLIRRFTNDMMGTITTVLSRIGELDSNAMEVLVGEIFKEIGKQAEDYTKAIEEK